MDENSSSLTPDPLGPLLTFSRNRSIDVQYHYLDSGVLLLLLWTKQVTQLPCKKEHLFPVATKFQFYNYMVFTGLFSSCDAANFIRFYEIDPILELLLKINNEASGNFPLLYLSQEWNLGVHYISTLTDYYCSYKHALKLLEYIDK